MISLVPSGLKAWIQPPSKNGLRCPKFAANSRLPSGVKRRPLTSHNPSAESAKTLGAHLGKEVRVVSADESLGTDALVHELMALVQTERERLADAPVEELPVLRPESRERFNIEHPEPGRFVIEGYRPVSFVEMMDTEMPGARDEIERRLERWGIARALRRAGIEPGDRMVFGEVELRWDA